MHIIEFASLMQGIGVLPGQVFLHVRLAGDAAAERVCRPSAALFFLEA